MATSEVFRPSDGNLLVRDFIAHGPTLSAEASRRADFRPQTQGGYRFGRLSHNSFFTRHNPHPTRVKHMKGLLGVPICTVNDDGYFANPRYSLQFPPNSFDSQKLTSWKGRVPGNAINVNKNIHVPKELVTFQRFSGLNGYPFKEKAIPRVGLVPVTETWRDELAAFTRGLAMDDAPGFKEPPPPKPVDEARPRTTVYSPDTGRIIPPPSRAVTRGQSRRGYMNPQHFIGGNFQHISAQPEWENLVLMMLCQILQTDDINAVQAWLCSAGDREKSLVMNLVRSAISVEEDHRQYPAEFITDMGRTKLPPINEKPGSSSGEVNRLVLDDFNQHNPPAETKTFHNTMVQTEEDTNWISAGEFTDQHAAHISEDEEDAPINLPISDVLKSIPNPVKKTLTPLYSDGLAPALKQEKNQVHGASKSRQRHSKSSFKDKIDSMWSQNQSVNTF